MKYIKTFESIKKKYKEGDYVLLDIKKIAEESSDVELQDDMALIDRVHSGCPFYDVVLPEDDEFHGYEVEESEIIRKLNKQEIEEYKLKQTAKKFNL